MRTHKDGKLTRVTFDSLADVARYLETAPRKWPYEESRKNDSSAAWDLNTSYDDAVRMARDGWIEGAQQAQQLLKAFTPDSPAPDQRIDFYGHMPHVPRYCAGAPDSMIRHTNPPRIGGGKVLTLYVAVNMSAGVDARYARNFGLGVAQYINQLETDGMRIELYAATALNQTYSDDSRRIAHVWKIKSAEQPLDLAVVAFAIGHPAMFRRLWFAMMERSDVPANRGYYYPKDVRRGDIVDIPNHAYILNGMRKANSYASTPEAALEHIQGEIDAALAEKEAA